MSQSPPPPPPEPEALPGARLFVILLVTLGIFAASTVVVVFLERAWTQDRSDFRHPSIPARLEEEKINLLEQVPFSKGPRSVPLKEAQRARLDRYGWADRARGLAHEPITQAMAQVAAQEGEAR
jgi:hypothetical protein